MPERLSRMARLGRASYGSSARTPQADGGYYPWSQKINRIKWRSSIFCIKEFKKQRGNNR